MSTLLIHAESYWTERWQSGETQWDIGYASTPIAEYIDQLENKDLKILIPGCGNAYEGKYLWDNSFENFKLLDISPEAVTAMQGSYPEIPAKHIVEGDFFEEKEQYDLIIEQTFFCALHPSERQKYVEQAQNLLKPNGNLVGLLFNIPLNTNHPPYGGTQVEYEKLFSPHFELDTFETAHNSIKPRADKELFINFRKA